MHWSTEWNVILRYFVDLENVGGWQWQIQYFHKGGGARLPKRGPASVIPYIIYQMFASNGGADPLKNPLSPPLDGSL